MYKYHKAGLSCKQFREDSLKDVEVILRIDEMVKEKELREIEMSKLMSQR